MFANNRAMFPVVLLRILEASMSNDRTTARLMLGIAAIFSLNKAAELLPWADSDARQWLEDRGLVCHVNGRTVVRWRDVLEALGDGEPVKPVPERRDPLPRVRL